jgi:hypothetical protein
MFRIVQRRVRVAISLEPSFGFNALGDVCLVGFNIESPRSSAAPQTQRKRLKWRRLGAR